MGVRRISACSESQWSPAVKSLRSAERTGRNTERCSEDFNSLEGPSHVTWDRFKKNPERVRVKRFEGIPDAADQKRVWLLGRCWKPTPTPVHLICVCVCSTTKRLFSVSSRMELRSKFVPHSGSTSSLRPKKYDRF